MVLVCVLGCLGVHHVAQSGLEFFPPCLSTAPTYLPCPHPHPLFLAVFHYVTLAVLGLHKESSLYLLSARIKGMSYQHLAASHVQSQGCQNSLLTICLFILPQVKSGTIFDNFLITNDEAYAEEFGNETWGVTKVGWGSCLTRVQLWGLGGR